MKIGILAVQGAFAEHKSKLEKLGARCMELRKKEDLDGDFDGLVLPGGASTVQGKLLRELEMFEPLKEKIQAGMPVLATCAGVILLADHLSNDGHVYFGTMPVTVKRNAYGRQLGSFCTEGGFDGKNIPLVFIRAPYVSECGENVKVLTVTDGKVTAVREKNMLAAAFHPELSDDLTVHSYFLDMVRNS